MDGFLKERTGIQYNDLHDLEDCLFMDLYWFKFLIYPRKLLIGINIEATYFDKAMSS